VKIGEESPGNKGHSALSRVKLGGDVREGMVTEKKITANRKKGKGEKVR